MATWESLGIDLQGRTGEKVRLPCPTCSPLRSKPKTPCLEVNTVTGLWCCHHCNWSGSLGTSNGVSNGTSNGYRPPPVYTKPPPWQPGDLSQQAIAWFARRGIPEAILRQFQVSVGSIYMPQVEAEVSAIQFPYFRGGELVNVKYRDKDKHFRMIGGAERIFYNLDKIDPACVLICEGEVDCLSIATTGVTSVVSVPDGAPTPGAKNTDTKFQFLDSAMDLLAPVKKIVLAVDNDAPGQALAEELARRLGPERCWRVTWVEGCKDANDVLKGYGVEALQRCLSAPVPWPIRGQITFQDLSGDLDLLYANGAENGGVSPGWPSLELYYRVKPGDVTVVTGQPQMGKSQWMSALMVNLAKMHDWRFAIFSPENYPVPEYAALLIEIYSGKPFFGGANRITPPERWEAEAWLNDHISFIAADEDQPTIPWLLELATISVKRDGIKGFIIDPWNECEHELPRGQTETQYIGETLMRIRRWARKYLVHVWVVAHPMKMQKAQKGDYAGQYPPATLYDISGSANWYNKPDNGIAVWRNLETKGPTEVHIVKARKKRSAQLGMVQLRYDLSCGRYYDLDEDYERSRYDP